MDAHDIADILDIKTPSFVAYRLTTSDEKNILRTYPCLVRERRADLHGNVQYFYMSVLKMSQFARK